MICNFLYIIVMSEDPVPPAAESDVVAEATDGAGTSEVKVATA